MPRTGLRLLPPLALIAGATAVFAWSFVAPFAQGLPTGWYKGNTHTHTLNSDGDGSLGAPTDLVARAHGAGLLIHVWTMRTDPGFLPAGYAGDAAAEFRRFRSLGIDGLFTDQPDAAVRALRDGR